MRETARDAVTDSVAWGNTLYASLEKASKTANLAIMNGISASSTTGTAANIPQDGRASATKQAKVYPKRMSRLIPRNPLVCVFAVNKQINNRVSTTSYGVLPQSAKTSV